MRAQIRHFLLALLTVTLCFQSMLYAESASKRYIVRLRSSGAQAQDVRTLGVDGVASILGTPVVKLIPNVNAAVTYLTNEQIGALKSKGEISYLEEDIRFKAFKAPNDPSFTNGSMYGLNGAYGIGAEAAWDLSTGSSDTVVAVIDSGVDYTHPDLTANIWENPSETVNGIDDDGNGYVDDTKGYDFANSDNDPYDDNEHGTHVSGTISAVGNNAFGVTGINWNAKIMALKALDSSGSGYLSDIALAVNYVTNAKRAGINVRTINMSIGAGSAAETLRQAIEEAGNEGILVAAAAGNESENNEVTPSYPAGYTESNIVSVAATDSAGRIASFSNYGATSVDLAAPGVSILSTIPVANTSGDPYDYFDGTSMATPHVAGVAALIVTVNNSLSVDQVKEILLSSVRHLDSLQGLMVTGGLLDASTAVAMALQTTGAHTLNGTVKAKRKGLAKVKVVLKDSSTGELVDQRTTSKDGRYSFSITDFKSYNLTVKKKNYKFKPAKATVDLSSASAVQNFTGSPLR